MSNLPAALFGDFELWNKCSSETGAWPKPGLVCPSVRSGRLGLTLVEARECFCSLQCMSVGGEPLPLCSTGERDRDRERDYTCKKRLAMKLEQQGGGKRVRLHTNCVISGLDQMHLLLSVSLKCFPDDDAAAAAAWLHCSRWCGVV